MSDREGAGVLIQERIDVGHLVLRGNLGDPDFALGARRVLHTDLPDSVDRYIESGPIRVFGTGPEEWLVVVPADTTAALAAELRRHCTGHFAVVDVSGGQTVLALEGWSASLILQKSCVYDLDPRRFAIGRAVSTVFAAATALVARTGEQSWELIIRRSFSDYIGSWVLEAGREYGVRVAGR